MKQTVKHAIVVIKAIAVFLTQIISRRQKNADEKVL